MPLQNNRSLSRLMRYLVTSTVITFIEHYSEFQSKRAHTCFCSRHTLSDFDCVSCLWSESASCDRLWNCGSRPSATTSVAVCSDRREEEKQKSLWLDTVVINVMKQVRVLAGHLCFERDLFLRVLECERDRDLERDTRRPLLDRLEERFFMSAGGRAAASSSERHFITKTWIACSTSKCLTWLYSSSDGGLGFPHPLHHTF